MSNDITKSEDVNALEPVSPLEGDVVESNDPKNALSAELNQGKNKKYIRVTLAALSSVPWIGSLLGAAAALSAEKDQDKVNNLLRLWVQEHEGKIKELDETLGYIYSRLDNFGNEIKERVESEEYLALVRSTFRSWDQVDTEEKRNMLKILIINAGAIKLCPDDLVRLFIKWINEYHESHFAVIKEIYKHPGITRRDIWENIRTERPRDNSAEADLFKYLIRELSTGGVIRQEKEVNAYGQLMKAQRRPNSGSSDTLETAFESTKPYVLTALGQQFIRYVLNDVVVRLEEHNNT